ncbi:MAG: pyridoxal 5'-phosphate synthase glutaminase subunit PdxT [Methanobacteriota archaeon]|nr:MAG: pyridoxal 5'-phosphate synthase glutaminase subunit PdxT [Euryarchaeota archaeon]
MSSRVVVVALQGDVSEHVDAAKAALATLPGGDKWVVTTATKPEEVGAADLIVLPGGESTTIGKLLVETCLLDVIRDKCCEGVGILGTCAGLVLLASEGDESVRRTGQPLIGLLDIKVRRNAFGRQKESFEAPVEMPCLGSEPFPGVFIRAPVVEKVWGRARPIAFLDDKIVGVEQDNIVAVAFHPELTDDPRLHRYVFGKVLKLSCD